MRFRESDIVDFTDEQLVLQAQGGSKKSVSLLLSRHYSLVRLKASRHHTAGLERDDLAQEGMLGLLSAIYAYDANSDASFKTYASVCIANRIASFVKSSRRKKQMPLNDYNNLDENIIGLELNPEEQVIEQDELRILRDQLYSRLSGIERSVITLYLAGCSYEEIGKQLGSTAKSVDNALQRVRRKLRKTITN